MPLPRPQHIMWIFDLLNYDNLLGHPSQPSRERNSPDAEELTPLSGSPELWLPDETPYMGDCSDSGSDEPRQPEHRGDPDQEGEHEQVQVVPVRLLQIGVAPRMNQKYLSSKYSATI